MKKKSSLQDKLDLIIQKYENSNLEPSMAIEYIPINDKFVRFDEKLLEKPSYASIMTYKLELTPGMDRSLI